MALLGGGPQLALALEGFGLVCGFEENQPLKSNEILSLSLMHQVLAAWWFRTLFALLNTIIVSVFSHLLLVLLIIAIFFFIRLLRLLCALSFTI